VVVALSSLRVGAEVDSSKYTAGMAEKVAADKQGAASSVAVGEAITATNIKISQSGDILTRLRRQYVDGAASAQRFENAITTLGRGIERGAVPLTEVSSILDGIYKKYQLTADAASLMERGQVELAQAVESANAKLKQQNSIVPANQNGKSASRFDTSNIAYQFQDIFSTAALGMDPKTIALQQGPQLASVFTAMGSGREVVTGLAGAFMSLVSPVSLITIGLTGAAAAAIQYFTATKSDSDKSAEALKNHSALIARIKEAWPQAAEGLREYSAESKTILTQNIKDSVELYKKAIVDASNAAASNLSGVTRRSRASGDPVVEQLTQASKELMNGVKAGNPDLKVFVERLIDIENQKGTPANLKEIIKATREAAASGIEAQGKLSPLIDTIHGVGSAAAAEAKRIDAFTKALNELAGAAPTPLTESEKLQNLYDTAVNRATTREQKDDAYSSFYAAQKRLSDQNPLVMNSDGRMTTVPTPENRPLVELEGLPGADKLAKSAQTARNAYRDVIKNANDRIQQMQLETQTAGLTGIAAETLSFKLKLLQDATDKGRTVTAAQRVEIEKLADAYRAAATAASVAKLQQDIAFQQRQLGRSSLDQTVASTLQQYGLPEDLNSTYAQLIRSNEQLKTARDLAGDFASTLANGLRQGEGLWQSLGDAATSVLTKISDMLLNDVLNALFKVNTAGASSGGGLLSGLGSLLGLGGGSSASSSSSFNWGLSGDFDTAMASGGAFSGGVRAFAGGGIFSNSIVSRPTLFPFANGTGLMGEAGPEAIMPLKRDGSGRLGVSAAAGNDNRSSSSSGAGGLHVSVGVSFDQDEGFRAYVKDVAQTEAGSAVNTGIMQYDDQMPDRVAQINLHPRRR
jgi:lambda family phage tail tape measure protein